MVRLPGRVANPPYVLGWPVFAFGYAVAGFVLRFAVCAPGLPGPVFAFGYAVAGFVLRFAPYATWLARA